MWSKICHVETFLHMINVETIFLSLFMLFCCKICFVAIYAVLPQNLYCRDTCFCVEKNLLRNCACGEKRTNMRYAVLPSTINATLYKDKGQNYAARPACGLVEHALVNIFKFTFVQWNISSAWKWIIPSERESVMLWITLGVNLCNGSDGVAKLLMVSM